VLWYANGAVLLQSVFPNLPRPLRTRKEVWKRIDRIRRLRNRVFHYEPIWKKRDLQEIDVIIHEMLHSISPDLEAILALSTRFPDALRAGAKGTQNRLLRLMETEELLSPWQLADVALFLGTTGALGSGAS
jgi:hypothetical protein